MPMSLGKQILSHADETPATHSTLFTPRTHVWGKGGGIHGPGWDTGS